MGRLPEVSGYLGYLSGPSREPALVFLVLFTVQSEAAQDPHPHGHRLAVLPGPSQTLILCSVFLLFRMRAFRGM